MVLYDLHWWVVREFWEIEGDLLLQYNDWIELNLKLDQHTLYFWKVSVQHQISKGHPVKSVISR